MKRLSRIFHGALGLSLLLLFSQGRGQTVIFLETMGSTSSQVEVPAYEANNGFDNDDLTMTSGGATRSALVSNANASSTVYYPGASGQANIYFGASSDTYGFAIEGIQASAYPNLSVQFGYRKDTNSDPAPLTFQYWNGTNYVSLTISFQEPNDAPVGWYLSPEIFLPPEACMDGLKLRWLKSGTTRTARIDDVVLKYYADPILMVNQDATSNICQVVHEEPLGLNSFVLSGLNLNGDAVGLTASQGFTLAENAGGPYSQTLSLSGYTGLNKEIWVGFDTGLETGDYTGQADISGGGAPGIQVNLNGRVYQDFDIPYYMGFRTADELVIAHELGFSTQNAEYKSSLDGYLGLTYKGYIITPEIDLSPHSHLNISFQSCGAESGSSIFLYGYISYSGGPYQFLFSLHPPNSTTFEPFNYIIQLQNSESQTTARIKFQKSDNYATYIRFREFYIRDLSNWTGAESTDWSNGGNWTLGVPGIKSEVIVPSTTNNPVLYGEGFVGSLTLGASTTLTIHSGGRLSVGRSLNNPNGTNGLIIEDGGSLIHPNAGVPATVKQNIAAANWADCTDGWHLVSAAVENQAIDNEWTPSGLGNDYDFFAWSEPEQLWLNQKEAANNITRFIPGQGYLVAYQQSGLKTFSGNLNAETLPVTLTRTTDNDYSGWNLLGNPYPCSLSWNDNAEHWGDLAALGINAYARLWDSGAKSYVSVAPGGMIPPNTGFMVQLTQGDQQTLSFPPGARVHPASSSKNNDSYEQIRLAAIEGNQVSVQESLLMFHPAASEEYDPYWDGHFLPGYAPFFCSLKGNEHLSVFSTPEINRDLIIPFAFEKNDGDDFQIALLENTLEMPLYLFDRKMNVEQLLDQDNPYWFTSTQGDEPGRFELRFQPANSSGLSEPERNDPVLIYSAENILSLTFRGEPWGGSLEIFDLSGRLLRVYPLHEGCCHSFRVNLSPGLYVARVGGLQKTWSCKVFIR